MILHFIKSLIKKVFIALHGGYMTNIKDTILNHEPYIAVDVGAAIGVQVWWHEVLEFATIYAYEPNQKSSKKLKKMYQTFDYHVIEEALDIVDGEKPIYLTNVPTGSSLLKPNTDYMYADPSYFFPYIEERIMTYSAENSFIRNKIFDIDLIKIDTQGTELNIVKGLGEDYLTKLLAIEFEAGLPGAYENQPTFLEIHEHMVHNHFELFDLKSARNALYSKTRLPYVKKHTVSKKIHEVDVLYFKNLEFILQNKNIPKLRKLIMSYCAYSFFDEALFAVQEGHRFNLFTDNERKLIHDSIIHWHDAKSVYFGHYHWFNYSS